MSVAVRRSSRGRRAWWAAAIGIVAVGGVLRALPLTAGLPYTNYVDEAFVLRPAAHMVDAGTWDPDFYVYPSWAVDAAAILTKAADLAGVDVGPGLQRTEHSSEFYAVEPAALIVAGRLPILLTSIATIVFAMALARRVAGRSAALVTGALVAVLPALVTRSGFVIVDTPAACFTMGALLFASLVDRRRGLWAAGVAGAMAGFAFTSKYPSATVLLSVLVVVALQGDLDRARRIRAGAVAIGSMIVTTLVVMPSLVLRTSGVRQAISDVTAVYGRKASPNPYWLQALDASEVGWIVCGLGTVGMVLLLRSRRSRPVAVGWLAGAVPMLAYLFSQAFQPFRNVLPLVPFIVLAAAVAIVDAAGWAARRWSWTTAWRHTAVAVMTSVVVLAVVVPGTGRILPNLIGVVDTRVQAVDWLASRVDPDDRVLVAAELGVVPSEIDRLRRTGADVVVARATGPDALTDTDGFTHIVTSRLPEPSPGWPRLAPLEPRPVFGVGIVPVPAEKQLDSQWRTNAEVVVIYER